MDIQNLSEKQINLLSNILSEAGYIQGKNLSRSSYEEIPEFVVLAKILMSPEGSLDSDNLQKDVEAPLAMVLSNLAADGIIVQSPSSYRWGFSPQFKEKINSFTMEEEEESSPPVEETNLQSHPPHSNEIYLASVLQNGPYASSKGIDSSTPEGQIILSLLKYGSLSSDEIEKKTTNPSISLALSNLQADGVIVQNPDYSWGLNPKLLDEAKQIQKKHLEELEAQKAQKIIEAKKQQGHIITFESEEFRSLLDALRETSYLNQVYPSQNLAEIPEIEILALLYRHESLTTRELEEKSQYPGSISLALSNLKADQLIIDNMDRWRLHQLFVNKISQKQRQKLSESKQEEEKEKERSKLSQIEEKNRSLRHIIQALEKRGVKYGDPALDPKFAASIPEIELLYILVKEGSQSTDELEKKVINRNSISLALSNLQADQIIMQDNTYQWQIVPSLMKDILDMQQEEIQIVQEVVEVPELHTSEALREKEILSDKLRLRKLFFDLGLIKNLDVPIPELMKRTDFELLSIILHHQPIETSDIEEKLDHPILLSMELSNLAADDLIYYSESESKWRISTRLQSMLRKIKLDETEILETLKNKPSLVTSEKVTGDENVEISPESSASPMDQKLANYLKQKGYEIDGELPYEEMVKVGEFEVLKIIAMLAPVSVHELEQKVSSHVSITLALSNLKADGLIVEEDYTYSLSPSLAQDIHYEEEDVQSLEVTHSGDVEEQKEESDVIEEKTPLTPAVDELEKEKKKSEEIRQTLLPFMRAVKSLGYIKEIDLPHSALLAYPEYEILYLIHENEGRPVDEIKQKVTSTSPVLVSRALKQFEVEGVVHVDEEGNVHLTDKFKQFEK